MSLYLWQMSASRKANEFPTDDGLGQGLRSALPEHPEIHCMTNCVAQERKLDPMSLGQPQRIHTDPPPKAWPRPSAYTREFPKLTCVGTGPRPRRVCRHWGFCGRGIGVFVVAALGRVDPLRTLATGRVGGQALRFSAV